jgi:hypothetical protein
MKSQATAAEEEASMIIDRIREDMSVIAADDRCVGFVGRVEGETLLRITSISAGYGYDHLIPLSWVCDADKYVYLDKPSAFVAANWQNAPVSLRRPIAAPKIGVDAVPQPKAA